MSTILLPIKPEYVEKIINKTKLYEYRKKQPKRKIDKIIIYSTTPIKKVVAEVEIEDIIIDNPIEVWNKTKEYSGISYKKYLDYYKTSSMAVAYKLGNVKVYKEPKDLKYIGINYAPQSYIYM